MPKCEIIDSNCVVAHLTCLLKKKKNCLRAFILKGLISDYHPLTNVDISAFISHVV